MKNKKKCVLAYSGGLDTSAITIWLAQRGYEIHAVLVDVGQQEDLPVLAEKALRLGAKTAVIRDAKPEMCTTVIPYAIGLGATYEGNYRLGTALARPFIAAEQVRLAKALGGATLVHGATGKGNDQIRFEFAYRSLAPDYPVLAPWKCWELTGRKDMIEYLHAAGVEDEYALSKDFSLDENLWHLSVEGSELEDPEAFVDVSEVLRSVSGRFTAGPAADTAPQLVRVTFEGGFPVALDGRSTPLPEILARLNQYYRTADWAWDLVIENRFTGIKSRGLYINPAAKLLSTAVDALARCRLNKPTYDGYCELGRQYGTMLYRGEYFSDQRVMLEAAASAVLRHLSGEVTVHLSPRPYAARIDAPGAIFRKALSTFEKSDFSHQDAGGFIQLAWLSQVGQQFVEKPDGGIVETGWKTGSDLRVDQPLPAGGLVPAAV